MTDLMKDFSEIDEVALDKLREAEKEDGGIQLPFPVAYAWAYTGKAAMKNAAATCPALYYGGFATDADKLAELVADGAVPGTLEKWYPFEETSKKGKTWNGLGTRQLTCAVIGSRSRWVRPDGSYSLEYDREAGKQRQHIQVLTLLYNNSKPWSYAVLSAGGFQVNFLKDAISNWYKAIKPHLKALNGERLPMSAFAISLGTFGEKANFKMVGKGDAQSPVTPIEAVIPADLTTEAVGKRFIGVTNVRANGDRLALAQEWLNAWKADGAGKGQRDEAPAREEEAEIPF